MHRQRATHSSHASSDSLTTPLLRKFLVRLLVITNMDRTGIIRLLIHWRTWLSLASFAFATMSLQFFFIQYFLVLNVPSFKQHFLLRSFSSFSDSLYFTGNKRQPEDYDLVRGSSRNVPTTRRAAALSAHRTSISVATPKLAITVMSRLIYSEEYPSQSVFLTIFIITCCTESDSVRASATRDKGLSSRPTR